MAKSGIPTIAELWAQAVALVADLEADDGPDPANWSDEYRADDWDRLWTLERAVFVGPINSRADAIAKLKAVSMAFERGPRADKLEDSAVVAVTAWLEAQS